jgi:hypothetical protein
LGNGKGGRVVILISEVGLIVGAAAHEFGNVTTWLDWDVGETLGGPMDGWMDGWMEIR